MLKSINIKTLYIVLFCFNAVQIVQSDDLAPTVEFINVSRYFCDFSANHQENGNSYGEIGVKLRDKVLNNDQNDSLEPQDGVVGCGTSRDEEHYLFFNKSIANIEKLYITDFSPKPTRNSHVTIQDIANGSNISFPRILPKMNSIVFFKETIGYEFAYPYYGQVILGSNGYELNIKVLLMIPFKDDSKPNLNLSKTPNSTQDDGQIFVPINDHLNSNWTIVFFASLDNWTTNYSKVRRHACTEDKFVSSGISHKLSIKKLNLTFNCADYASNFTITGNDTCPKFPKKVLKKEVLNSKINVSFYFSTWESSVCYKFDLGNLRISKFLRYIFITKVNNLFKRVLNKFKKFVFQFFFTLGKIMVIIEQSART